MYSVPKSSRYGIHTEARACRCPDRENARRGGGKATRLVFELNTPFGAASLITMRASKVPRPAFRQKRGTERTGGLGISEHAVPVARAGECRALRLARAEPPKGEGSTRMLREVETRETVQGRIRDTTVKSQGRGTNSRHRLRPHGDRMGTR